MSENLSSTSVAIVGLGKVGKSLAFLLKELGYKLETFISRRPAQTFENFKDFPVTKFVEIDSLGWAFPIPNLLFITTPDKNIQSVVSSLASYKKNDWQKTIVFHCSGALSSYTLSPLAQLGASIASLHPLKSFASNINSLDELEKIYWCFEGNEKAKKIADNLVSSTKGNLVVIEPSKKALYHAAAVMSCGHMVALLDIGQKMLLECGIKEDQAKEMLMPLIEGTIKNFAVTSSSKALTGPFARNDYQTINQHLQALKKLPEDYLTIYSLLGRHSLTIKN
jgi:predicted short-subunit dehydrogenase-like oxidoreductase (DUF2520 family)